VARTPRPDQVKQAYLASVPAGRMGTPGDIAHAVSFLVSEGAGFITGQRIVVDGWPQPRQLTSVRGIMAGWRSSR
jgi:NAD(P)-dependent dehydrogenase (short-subunit alcohol dehydrogenase family)